MSDWVDPKDRLPNEGDRVIVEYDSDPPETHKCRYWEAVNGCDLMFEADSGFLILASEVLRWRPIDDGQGGQ